MKNFLNTKTASKTNSLIIIFLSLFTLTFISFSFEAKADLVDDLIKKHKLDPKNNLKDQCILMTELSLVIRGPGGDDYVEEKGYAGAETQIVRKSYKNNEKRNDLCLKNFCVAEITILGDKRGIDKYHAPWLVYQKLPFKIIGLDIGNYTVYDYYDEQKKIIESTYYLVGKINNNKKMSFVQLDKLSSKKNPFYIKTRACYIEEYNVVNNHFLPTKNHK